MAIRSLDNVSCGMNLGLIYSLSYSYSPQGGTSITVFFVNAAGEYAEPGLLPPHKTNISIGNAYFSVYPVASSIEKSEGRRIMKVEFVDEFFLLNNYYVVLPGRGCGRNVYVLGDPVDNRTAAQKVASAIDPTAQQIKALTQFPDYEYTFNQFLAVLRLKFSVQMLASVDATIKHDFTGSFRDVLDAWCQWYNLAFFFENASIKIFDPTRLSISLPAKPTDAIEYTVSQDIRDTYGKTVCNWFQQDGGQYALSQTSNSKGPLYVRTNTLFPVGYEFNLPQTTIDPNQCAAAMYGQHFWFLYNYYKGTTAKECGWTPIEQSTINTQGFSIVTSVTSLGGRVAIFDENVFNERFSMYQQYGQQIAGRWYLSSEESELATDKNFQWFDETAGQILTFNNVDDRVIKLDFLTPTDSTLNAIAETVINNQFAGVNYTGNRIVYKDDYKVDWAVEFAYSADPAAQTNMANLVEQTFQRFFSIKGSDSLDFSQISTVYSNATFLAYAPSTVPQDIIIGPINGLSDKLSFFQPRFTDIPIKGISNTDYSSLKAAQSEPQNVQIVGGTQGPNVITNTSVIKTVQQGNYTIYYDKYSDCKFASTPDAYFGYHFEPNQISSDNQIGITFSKQAGNTYRLTRDYGFISQLVNNPYLTTLAQPRSFPTRTVSFALNYFYSVPDNFLSNGLVSMDVSVGDNGITSTYTFSNSVLQPRNYSKQAYAFEQNIRNSWIRTYRPNEVIT